MIIAVAIKLANGEVKALPKPNRHHDVIHMLAKLGYPTPVTDEQGFMDDQLGFLGRGQAKQRAIDIKQLTKHTPSSQLFSEDLW